MRGVLWADVDYGLLSFIILTVLGGSAAWAIGAAFAKSWTQLWLIIPAAAVLSAAVRFLHFSLFQEELLSVHFYIVIFIITLVVCLISYKAARAKQMATQYSWAFVQSGLSWRER
jgi:hypothetical protein